MILYLQIPQDLQACFSSARIARHLGSWTGVFAASVRCSGLEPSVWVRVVSPESPVRSRQNPAFPARRIAWPKPGTRRPEGARRSAENCSVLCGFVLGAPSLCAPCFAFALSCREAPAPLDTIHVTARLQEKLRVLRIFLPFLRVFLAARRAFKESRLAPAMGPETVQAFMWKTVSRSSA